MTFKGKCPSCGRGRHTGFFSCYPPETRSVMALPTDADDDIGCDDCAEWVEEEGINAGDL